MIGVISTVNLFAYRKPQLPGVVFVGCSSCGGLSPVKGKESQQIAVVCSTGPTQLADGCSQLDAACD